MNKVESILKDLVSFPCIGGRNSNLPIIEYIQKYLKEHGVESFLDYNEDKTRANLHCRIGPSVDGGVILSGHTDVVPVEGQDWETDPWVLTDKGDGKLYGRGSCDMKGFIACCLAALPDMLAADLKKPIYFAFSYDEEVGCIGGPFLVNAIKTHYTETPTYAIIGEPSMMLPTTGQKGICIYETTVHGSAGHSSRIKQEVSAIHEAARLVLWLEGKMDDLIKGELDERFVPPHSSLHIGIFNGGIAANVVADVCTFHWDVRTIPSDKLEDIKADFDAYVSEREKELQKTFAGARIVTHEHHPPVPPLDTPDNLPIVDLVKKLSGNHTLDAVSYAAEAGQFAQGGFQSIICGPGSIAQAHRANEFIDKEQLKLGVEMLRKLVVAFS
ncbi:MAG: acetylornithine deacetylase [Bacteroidota bacterium]